MINYSWYGAYRTRTFKDIFESSEDFKQCLNDSPLSLNISDDELAKIHYMLYAKYGNSHIASSDENQFKAKLQLNMYSYYPVYKRKKEAIEALLVKNEAELRAGQEFLTDNSGNSASSATGNTNSRNIENHAMNPGEMSAEHGIDEDTMLTYINDQVFSKGSNSSNTSTEGSNSEHTDTKGKTALLNAYNDYLSLLASYEEEFLLTFKNLFIKIVSPQGSLYYESEVE